MKIQKFEVGPFAENTYLLTSKDKSLLIDPGFSNDREFKAFRAKLADTNTRLAAILLTHAHIDHVLGLPVVLDAFDVDVYLSHEDLHPWNHISEQAKMFGITAGNLEFIPKELPSDQKFSVDIFEMKLLYTPGHAPDHISVYFEEEDVLIAGDTLFQESVGRTDLYKGSSELLTSSIREKLYKLPDSTIVYPGHGPATTIGDEKRSNPFVRQ